MTDRAPVSSSLTKKLHLKPGHRLLLLAAPEPVRPLLEPLPEGVRVVESADGDAVDAVLAFVRDRVELARTAPQALAALRPGGLLWLAYPKKSSGMKSDLTRDVGWEPLTTAGWEGVAQIAVDEVWAATRFRPAAEVKRRAR